MGDEGLPKSTLAKAIKEMLPEDMRIAGDAVDALVKCANEFVQMLSNEANELSEKEKKTTITPDHVIGALRALEFDAFLDVAAAGAPPAAARPASRALPAAPHQPLNPTTLRRPAALADFKDGAKEAAAARKSKLAARADAGYSQEELLAMQQRLLEEARARTLSGPPPPALGEPATAAAAPAAAAAAAPAGEALDEEPLGSEDDDDL